VSELHEAAQAIVSDWDDPMRSDEDMEQAIEHLRAALAQPEPEAPRDEWRPASEPPEDGRRVLIWVATESGEETFRPAYCPVGGWTSVCDGETLVAWRDVTPPTESPIAAKCQRIERSGEICGLTPPCPDCGSSLIDVPEGSL